MIRKSRLWLAALAIIGLVAVPAVLGAAAQVPSTGRGVIFASTATASTTTGTSEQVLGSYQLPINALANAGDTLHIVMSFSAAANVNNKTFKCYFGSQSYSSGALAANGTAGFCDIWVTKVGSSQQIIRGQMNVGTTVIAPWAVTNSAQNDQAAITIQFTGTDGTSSAGDITMNHLLVVKE